MHFFLCSNVSDQVGPHQAYRILEFISSLRRIFCSTICVDIPCMLLCVFSVRLTRAPGQSLGISIMGGRGMGRRLSSGEMMRGVFIKHISPDSPAAHNGTLRTGDRILEVCVCECVCLALTVCMCVYCRDRERDTFIGNYRRQVCVCVCVCLCV